MIFFVFQNAHYMNICLCVNGIHNIYIYISIFFKICIYYKPKEKLAAISEKKQTTFLQESQDFQRHWKQTLHTLLDRSDQRHGSWISEPSTGPVLVSDRWFSQQLSIIFCNFEPTVSWCPEINIFKYDLKLVNHYLIWWYLFFNKYGRNVCEVELPLGFHMQLYAPLRFRNKSFNFYTCFCKRIRYLWHCSGTRRR